MPVILNAPRKRRLRVIRKSSLKITIPSSEYPTFIFRLGILIVYRNLYYIELLQENEPVTVAEFEQLWSALPKDQQKV